VPVWELSFADLLLCIWYLFRILFCNYLLKEVVVCFPDGQVDVSGSKPCWPIAPNSSTEFVQYCTVCLYYVYCMYSCVAVLYRQLSVIHEDPQHKQQPIRHAVSDPLITQLYCTVLYCTVLYCVSVLCVLHSTVVLLCCIVS